MRRFAAALLVAVLVALAWAPHVHTVARGDQECAACVMRGSEPAHSDPLDLAPALVAHVLEVSAPVALPATGAPLGAVPGQSPPVNA